MTAALVIAMFNLAVTSLLFVELIRLDRRLMDLERRAYVRTYE